MCLIQYRYMGFVYRVGANVKSGFQGYRDHRTVVTLQPQKGLQQTLCTGEKGEEGRGEEEGRGGGGEEEEEEGEGEEEGRKGREGKEEGKGREGKEEGKGRNRHGFHLQLYVHNRAISNLALMSYRDLIMDPHSPGSTGSRRPVSTQQQLLRHRLHP